MKIQVVFRKKLDNEKFIESSKVFMQKVMIDEKKEGEQNVETICDECGTHVKMSPSQFKRSKNHFCSVQCHMKFMNRELNPTRMTPEVREKVRNARLGTGEGKTYTKTYGRHTHRIVAEQMLGRPLKEGEIVHHIDGNKRNNDPSNLMVMTQSEHCRLHFKKGGDAYETISTSGR